jgi:autotransporter-associated beta strand protein
VITPCPYTINGGTLLAGTLSASIGAFKITGGTVTGTGTLTSNATYDVRGGRIDVNLGGSSLGLTKSDSTTAVLTGVNTYTGQTTVSGGTLQLGPSAQNCILNMGGADIRSGGIVFDYAGVSDPAATIQGLLTASYDGGLWDVGRFRNSLASSSALTLGWVDDVSSSQVKVMSTYAGDFNLDGAVDNLDRAIWFANAFSGSTWSQGDANYDGVVNGLDRDLWFANAGRAPRGGMMPVAAATPVPEPGTFGLLVAGLLGLLAHRWTRRK